MEQQQTQQMDRRTAILEAFETMSDDAQADALCMLQSIARSSPRRATAALRLIASNGASDGLRQAPGGR